MTRLFSCVQSSLWSALSRANESRRLDRMGHGPTCYLSSFSLITSSLVPRPTFAFETFIVSSKSFVLRASSLLLEQH
eukprot:scaffold736_cov114-Skeletonema_dohrnii-CCMP3373.AAC.1